MNQTTKNDKKVNPKTSVPESSMNLIYPPICGICGKLSKEFLCIKCYKLLENQAKFKGELVGIDENGSLIFPSSTIKRFESDL